MAGGSPVTRGTSNPTPQEVLAHEVGNGPATDVAMPAHRWPGARYGGGGIQWNRPGLGWGTLMRHFLLSRPVAALAPGMPKAPLNTALIPAAGRL